MSLVAPQLASPAGWSETSITIHTAPEVEHGFRRNLVLRCEPRAGRELVAFSRKLREDLVRQRFPELRFLGEQRITAAGCEAIELSYEHAMPSPQGELIRLMRWQVALASAEQLYELTYSVAAAAAAARESEYRAMLAALRL
jgi:hypothetical protein